MQLMRRLMMLSLTQNKHFYAKHIQGVDDIAADLLSRCIHLDKEQTTVQSRQQFLFPQ